MESFYRSSPIRLDPFQSLIAVYLIAFIPHMMKIGVVKKKVGKNYSIANSRLASTMSLDNTPTGVWISTLIGCHTNGLEAFSYFAAAIIGAVVAGVPKDVVEGAAALFVAIRLAYTFVYLGPLNGGMRTLVWALGVLLSMNLLYIASTYY